MRIIGFLLVFALLLVGCGQAAEPETSDATAAPVTATIAPTVTRTPPPSDTVTPTSEPLTAGDIFARLSPSVAYIATSSGSGSGALLAGGYVLTNAHVVWPYDAADITFPDGTTFEATPLVARDALHDIALLGPLDVDLPPITFADGESAIVGSDVLLIGYPGESDRAPQPTLSEGLISRVREWEDGGITFFQTSSAVAGGQSGGIAISPDGEAIGLSGLRFTEANYGLVASAVDLMPFIDEMIASASEDAGDLAEPKTKDSARFTLSAADDKIAYRIAGPPETQVEISVEGPGDIGLDAYYPDGQVLAHADDTSTGKETLRFKLPPTDVPIFFVVTYKDYSTGRFALTSNQPLIEIFELDDGRPVNIDDSYIGTIDFPFDSDAMIILLDEGEEVTVGVDTIGFDPVLVIDGRVGRDNYVGDNNSGGGLFGVNPELTYKAPNSGTVNAFVIDLSGTGAGSAYTISVKTPYEGAPTPMSPAPTPTPIVAVVGPMRLYDDPILPFTFEVPVNFEQNNGGQFCRLMALGGPEGACLGEVPLSTSDLGIFAFSEDTVQLGIGELTLEEYVSIIRKSMDSNPAITRVSEHPVETAAGDPAIVLEISGAEERFKLQRFIHVSGRRVANNLYFTYDLSQQEMVDYIISTYRVR